MCFRRSRYWEERSEERGERLWDLFHRETAENEPPTPVAEREDERVTELEREEVPTAALR